MTSLNPTQTQVKKRAPGFAATLIMAALLAGTLDISAAIFILAKGHAKAVLRYIAGAVYGKDAAKTGDNMVFTGLIIHYLIAAGWVTLYFMAYKHVSLLRKNIIAVTIFYGLFVWAMMNRVIVPMTKIQQPPFNLTSALINAVILMVCIALPAVWMRNWYERSKQ